MPKRVGVFADVSNLYYSIAKKFDNSKLNYRAYMKFIKPLGTITRSIAYGAQREGEAQDFINYLKSVGFLIKYKAPKTYYNEGQLRRKADWDVGIAVDMIDAVLGDDVDLIVLASADGDMTPVVQWVQRRGVKCIVFGCGISHDLKTCASESIEIYEGLLRRS